MNYHIWTIGCQMNKAESNDIAEYLESCGLKQTEELMDAGLVIINTCVVRQHAEDKIKSLLGHIRRIKSQHPHQLVAVTGCFVDTDTVTLLKKYPQVDLFFPPGDLNSLKQWYEPRELLDHHRQVVSKSSKVSVYLPIMQGCDNFCSYCIVPYRRGRERSRPPDEILREAKKLVDRGVKEVVLLGQNVNSYGKGLPQSANLALLLKQLNEIEGLSRIRFLTNHPRDMSSQLIEAMASANKVCHHICLPLQSGDDLVLKRMNRHYTYEQYHALVNDLREAIPDVSFSTDIIVGFPGETEEQFNNTFNAIKEIGYDSVHVACYSPRPGTQAFKSFADDVQGALKQAMLHKIEQLQKSILQEINSALLRSELEVLIEGKRESKWFGRTYHDKLVFTESSENLQGAMVNVLIDSATPWSLQGKVVHRTG